jgi:hypothetical protein
MSDTIDENSSDAMSLFILVILLLIWFVSTATLFSISSRLEYYLYRHLDSSIVPLKYIFGLDKHPNSVLRLTYCSFRVLSVKGDFANFTFILFQELGITDPKHKFVSVATPAEDRC